MTTATDLRPALAAYVGEIVVVPLGAGTAHGKLVSVTASGVALEGADVDGEAIGGVLVVLAPPYVQVVTE